MVSNRGQEKLMPEFPKVLKNYNAYFIDEVGKYTILERCIICKAKMQEISSKSNITVVKEYANQPVPICLECYNAKFNEDLKPFNSPPESKPQ